MWISATSRRLFADILFFSSALHRANQPGGNRNLCLLSLSFPFLSAGMDAASANRPEGAGEADSVFEHAMEGKKTVKINHFCIKQVKIG